MFPSLTHPPHQCHSSGPSSPAYIICLQKGHPLEVTQAQQVRGIPVDLQPLESKCTDMYMALIPKMKGGDLWVYELHTDVHMHTHALCNFPMSPGKPLGDPQLQHPWSQLTPFPFSSGHRSSSLR